MRVDLTDKFKLSDNLYSRKHILYTVSVILTLLNCLIEQDIIN